MEEVALPSDAGAELRILRARAFGPNPDITDDPVAMARLDELEGALAAGRARTVAGSKAASAEAPDGAVLAGTPAPPAPVEPGQESDLPAAAAADTSMWRRATSTTTGRLWLVVGGLVVAIALVYAVIWPVGPRPDATMHPLATEPDSQVLGYLTGLDTHAPDPSTVRAYEAYRGIELFSGIDPWGSPCLYGYERARDSLLFVECTPREGELFGDIGDWPQPWRFEGLEQGSVIRFQLRGNVVDAFVYPASDG